MRLLVTVTGPTASGKTELLKVLTQSNTFKKLVSVTTRPKRDGEIEGEDYYFISESDFEELVENDQIVQSVNFNGFNYATTKSEIDKVFGTSRIPVVIVEPGGIDQFKNLEHELDYTVYSCYITAPWPVLEVRYLQRLNGAEPTHYDNQRLKAIRDEYDSWGSTKQYDWWMVNQTSNPEDLNWLAKTFINELGEFIISGMKNDS
jgi:guanylate kinase